MTNLHSFDVDMTKNCIHFFKHKFSYLYIPFGGSKLNQKWQIFSVICSFIFISLWHGYSFRIVSWTFANSIMVISEIFYSRYVKAKPQIVLWLENNAKIKRTVVALILAVWQMILFFFSFFLLSDDKTAIAIYSDSICKSKLLKGISPQRR